MTQTTKPERIEIELVRCNDDDYLTAYDASQEPICSMTKDGEVCEDGIDGERVALLGVFLWHGDDQNFDFDGLYKAMETARTDWDIE